MDIDYVGRHRTHLSKRHGCMTKVSPLALGKFASLGLQPLLASDCPEALPGTKPI